MEDCMKIFKGQYQFTQSKKPVKIGYLIPKAPTSVGVWNSDSLQTDKIRTSTVKQNKTVNI